MNDTISIIVGVFVLATVALALAELRRKPKRKEFPHTPGELADVQQRLFNIDKDEDTI